MNKTDNNMIADFMNSGVLDNYHLSWNALMSVVEFIKWFNKQN